ncbi:hypothetical protein [Nocardia otitidiscaviarum]|uniref:hypothetical protein n=1 Tax=Nocardia otitidiscaviarum TaxID=1823 RepID=UPI0004A73BB8|nr:hypothetical protein [Nocardia otitidiscaviarum]
MAKPVTLTSAGVWGAGGDVDMAGARLIGLGSGTAGTDAVNLTQLETVPFVGETYAGDLNNAPLGWISCTPSVTNAPGIAGSGGYLIQTFQNEDNSARAQVAYSVAGGEIAIRFNLGGWGAWRVHDPESTPRVGTVASSATPAINVDNVDMFTITALAVAITSMSTNLTGSPNNGQKLTVRIKDNGTARAITWGTAFVSSGVASLLTTTVANKTHLVDLRYDSAAAKWVCVACDLVGY